MYKFSLCAHIPGLVQHSAIRESALVMFIFCVKTVKTLTV